MTVIFTTTLTVYRFNCMFEQLTTLPPPPPREKHTYIHTHLLSCSLHCCKPGCCSNSTPACIVSITLNPAPMSVVWVCYSSPAAMIRFFWLRVSLLKPKKLFSPEACKLASACCALELQCSEVRLERSILQSSWKCLVLVEVGRGATWPAWKSLGMNDQIH